MNATAADRVTRGRLLPAPLLMECAQIKAWKGAQPEAAPKVHLTSRKLWRLPQLFTQQGPGAPHTCRQSRLGRGRENPRTKWLPIVALAFEARVSAPLTCGEFHRRSAHFPTRIKSCSVRSRGGARGSLGLRGFPESFASSSLNPGPSARHGKAAGGADRVLGRVPETWPEPWTEPPAGWG